MTAPAPDTLLAELHKAAAAAASAAGKLTDMDVVAPSTLSGWTRGHVLAHIAGISHAMARQLEYAARGETVELYDGGQDGRNNAINAASGHDAATHREDLQAALDRVLKAFDSVAGPEAPGLAGPGSDPSESGAGKSGVTWQTPIAYRGGVVLDGGLALWRELVIHTSDLGTGPGAEAWSRLFCEHLFDFLAARVPPGDKLVLQPLGLPPVTIGSGGRSVVISGMITDIAAWLAGREPSLGSLRASAAADGVDLPTLLPWPSGVPAAQ
ncbi:maleylpyruvate isomerase family mycothiol-dependent enzyme [Arthrobacter sp. CDRTa11]|uniref:maleylpyruvate isomerase family mycothiol-dependent enzyme n=1 Tax=Arthrobacter sp. CDRTa11 TaxID=2651199 RepID=UPI002265BA86|nr:maleylpyruvate isomerase family mycothiol-dependent enzyme [Arthrobacter sp. CDRTa11]UZX02617.1 maleylpyruvate isomerase family mycothiol-dependent enzyme [Arthrobacter sp. CDRTa11]